MRSMAVKHRLLSLTLALGILSIAPAHADEDIDITLLGGDTTQLNPGFQQNQNAIQVNTPNISSEELRLDQLSGFEVFHGIATEESGLGPQFVNDGCASCHVQNGKGSVRIRAGRQNGTSMVIKVAMRGEQGEDGAPVDVPGIGEQLQHRTVDGKSLYRLRLRWKSLTRRYPDGSVLELRRPHLTFRVPGVKKRTIGSSLRMTPMLFGSGLLESIPEQSILDLSDPEDSDNNGISGKPSYVPDRENGGFALGRFGFRASQPTVAQQTAAASFLDMGVVTELFNPSGLPVEVSEDDFYKLVVYQELASVPPARDQTAKRVTRGKKLFQEFGCSDCHVMSFVTENEQYTELDGQLIHPFTDLLLHDMGPGLADTRPEFSANGREWRTTPLWGLGFSKIIGRNFGVRATYLHDGRARSPEEAIMWHGGEASKSRNAFRKAKKRQRRALLTFLDSL